LLYRCSNDVALASKDYLQPVGVCR
jgi:hypothetical protein